MKALRTDAEDSDPARTLLPKLLASGGGPFALQPTFMPPEIYPPPIPRWGEQSQGLGLDIGHATTDRPLIDQFDLVALPLPATVVHALIVAMLVRVQEPEATIRLEDDGTIMDVQGGAESQRPGEPSRHPTRPARCFVGGR